MKDLRSAVAKVVVASFSLAALLGILALLGGGDFSDTQGRVLLTTVVVGVESVAVLCYLAVAGTRRAPVGVVGGLVSLVPFGVALWFTWGTDGGDGGFLWRAFGVGLTVAASLAQVSLLLSATGQPRRRARGLLVATLVAIAVLAAMVVVPIVADPDLGDWYWRVLGVVAILDVLGTVVVIVLQRVVGPARRAEAEPALLAPAVESRLVDAARARGTSPSALVSDLLDGFVP